MNINDAIRSLAANPPNNTVAGLIQNFVKIQQVRPIPSKFVNDSLAPLTGVYANNPSGLALAFIITVLRANNAVPNLPDPRDGHSVMGILNQFGTTGGNFGGQAGYVNQPLGNQGGFNSGFDMGGGGSFMNFSGSNDNSNTVDDWHDDEAPYQPSPKQSSQEPVVAYQRPKLAIYTLTEILASDVPLVKNCIYVPVGDYKSRVNLTITSPFNPPEWGGDIVGASMGINLELPFMVDNDKASVTGLLKDKSIHDLEVVSNDIRSIVSLDPSTMEQVGYIRNIMYVNGVVNKITNVFLKLMESGIDIDNGFDDLKALMEAVNDETRKSIEAMVSAFLGNDSSVQNTYKLDLLHVRSLKQTTVELCLLVASEPLILDSVVHANLIKALIDAMKRASTNMGVLSLKDGTFLFHGTKDEQVIICSLDLPL